MNLLNIYVYLLIKTFSHTTWKNLIIYLFLIYKIFFNWKITIHNFKKLLKMIFKIYIN
jgi:hypothetical protein